MFPIPLRVAVFLSLFAVLGWPAPALANHGHIGGGSSSGGGADPDADCLVWGYVVTAHDAGTADAGSDAGMSDGGDTADASQPADAGTNDAGGPPAGAVLVCLEHATMFGCDCAAGAAAGERSSRGAALLIAAAFFAVRRRRRAANPGRTP